MKVLPGFRLGAFLVLGGLLAAAPVPAQTTLVGFSVSNAPGPISVSNTLTYTISVTNLTSIELAGWVTNAISGPAQVTTAVPVVNLISNNLNTVVFALGTFVAGSIEQFAVTVQPSAAGTINNTVTVVAVSSGATNTVSTFVLTVVTNSATPAQADLAVSVTGPDDGALVGDYISFGIAVSNLGPAAASGVTVSNSFSGPAVIFISGPLANGTSMSLGTLNSGAVANLSLRVEPTTNGPLSFTATVTASSPTDPNTTNNIATTNITVGAFITNQLTVSNITEQVYDPQTGLVEQTIRLTNIGTNSVASGRVIAFDFGTSNSLDNAVGTNAAGTNIGNPFVVYGAALATNSSVDLVMEFFLHDRVPITSFANYTAVPGPAVDLSASAVISTNVTRVIQLPTGRMLVEFPSILGRSYTILYSDRSTYTNRAEPPIVAPADRVQWIDAGPPKTFQFPDTNRAYGVLLNP